MNTEELFSPEVQAAIHSSKLVTAILSPEDCEARRTYWKARLERLGFHHRRPGLAG
jgi:hypothetical protein